MDQPRLSQYELQHMLDNDQLSELWKAFDIQQKRYVHIKILHIPQAALGDFAPKFLQETQKLTALRHPHIAQIIDTQIVTSAQGNNACVVTEYLEGQLLSEFLDATVRTGNFLAPIALIKLLSALGSAIDYAHQRGVIHGAIQPANILLSKQDASNAIQGEVKLLGFGMHHLIPAHALPLESTRYISPERAQNLHENLRSDIYALGVLLYELSTGAFPFQGETSSEILAQQVQAIPTSPALINPRIRPSLTAVIMRSLAKEPAYRFPTAMALVGAAARALQVGKEFPNLVNMTPSLTPPDYYSGPLSGPLDPMNSPTHLTPTHLSQPSGAFSPIPATGNYAPPTQQPPWNTGVMSTVQATPTANTGAFNMNSNPGTYAAAETIVQPHPGYKPPVRDTNAAPGPSKLYIGVISCLVV
ncbi:MAG TPA: protein kinase, partial [Ktedonobacteraceae bacterium]